MDRSSDNIDADLFLFVNVNFVELAGGADEGDTTAGDNAFFNSSPRGVKGIFDARFFLFHFDLSRGTNLDNGNAAYHFG